MLPDVTPTYLARVDAVEVGGARGGPARLEPPRDGALATLAGHMFTVRVTAPLDDVLRVEVVHHRGRRRRGPAFELALEPGPLTVAESSAAVTVRAGALVLEIARDPWAMRFVDAERGEPITRSAPKALGLMDKAGHGRFLREQLELAPGEQVYGLGERFSAFCRNGQSVDMWNADCGTCWKRATRTCVLPHQPRLGLFVNSPGRSPSRSAPSR
jgi:alpha-D-xyloside xylohydrolase